MDEWVGGWVFLWVCVLDGFLGGIWKNRWRKGWIDVYMDGQEWMGFWIDGHDTHADIITIQETNLNPKANTQVHNLTTERTDRLHKAGGGLITLIRVNITFTTTDTPSTINTHNTELQMIKVHINNTKHITIAKIYIPPRNTTSTHYKTADTDIQHCIQYITNIPHSVLTGDVNAHSTLWHWYN